MQRNTKVDKNELIQNNNITAYSHSLKFRYPFKNIDTVITVPIKITIIEGIFISDLKKPVSFFTQKPCCMIKSQSNKGNIKSPRETNNKYRS